MEAHFFQRPVWLRNKLKFKASQSPRCETYFFVLFVLFVRRATRAAAQRWSWVYFEAIPEWHLCQSGTDWQNQMPSFI